MPVQTMQSFAEHQLFKAATPLVAAVLIGCVTWLFVTVMELEKELHLIKEGKIPAIEMGLTEMEDLAEDLEHDIESMQQKLTDVRIDHSGMIQQLRTHPDK